MPRRLPSMIVIGTGASAEDIKRYQTMNQWRYSYGFAIYLVQGKKKLPIIDEVASVYSNARDYRLSHATTRSATVADPEQPHVGYAPRAVATSFERSIHQLSNIAAGSVVAVEGALPPWRRAAQTRAMTYRSSYKYQPAVDGRLSTYAREAAFYRKWVAGIQVVEAWPPPDIEMALYRFRELARDDAPLTSPERIKKFFAEPLEAHLRAAAMAIPVHVVPEVPAPDADGVIQIDVE